ncbi:MAG: hypothetical protein JNJ78_20610, partial [Anaerolineae bacterium]|nr:hypothetical protein [Anaerolineae bacterium]
DTVGAAAWSAAGIRGSGVNIAVIDTGFGASVINNAAGTEYACLFQGTLSQGAFTAGDTTHGLNVLQVLCDIAPAARAYMYKATTASELAAAITAANTANHKVILITMDLGASVSPGDGTGGGALYGIDAVYTAISTARAAGRVVIASAGNNNGRYVTLNYTSAATTIPMTVFGGDRIHVSWNDWSGTSQNVGLNITGQFTTSVNAGGTPRVGPPSSSYTVQAGTCAVGCAINLNVTGSTSGIVLQVQVLGQGTIDSENITGATIASTAGNIARPADAQDVIAVGAVCNTNGSGGFPIDPYSSIGPVFGTGGTLQSLSAPYTRDQVKPDVVGPTHVSINNPTLVQNPDNPDEPTDLVPQGRVNPQNPTSCSNYTLGFNGTSAAAAHVAGMAALLVSNTNTSMSTFDGSDGSAVNAIQDYLQTHAIDLPMFTFGMAGFTSIPNSILSDSFDMTYGAGFTTLGNPSYNLANTTNPATEANQLTATCTTPIYVGQGNPGGPQSGTIANPYVSIAYALRQATTQCVVVLPGEYVSPIFIPSGVTAPGLQSYEGATSFASSPTYLWVTNNYNREGGFNVRNNDIVIDGFTVQSGRSYKFVDNYPSPGFVVDGGGTFLNNTFSNFFVPLRVQDSTAASFIGNTFSGFNIQATTVGSGGGASTTSDFDTAALRLQNAGTTAAPIVVRNNIFTTNTIQVSTLVTTNHRSAVLGIKNSAVNVYNNQFLTNTTGTLIGVNQWVGAVDSTKRTDEVRMVGNTFVGNTNNGPLIHLFQAPRMRFVNNTAVGNSMTGPQFFDEYFLYGHPGSSSGAVMYAQLSDRRMEIHNNLFYGNGVANDGLVATPGSDPIGCDAISGSNPLRNNWFLPVTLNDGVGADRASDCNTRVTNSITTTITPATTFFGSSTDAAHPYRLRPNDTVGDVGGINTGDNQALIDIFGDPGYLSLQLLDLRGTPRVRIGANANPTYNNVNAVDVGAYELDIPVPPEADDIDLVIIEDAAPSISIPLTATGGYIQTFAVTSSPANYDTNVNNACLGQPLRFTPPNTVTYCPPADFHTQYGTGNTHVPITFTYTVTDSIFYPAQPSTGTVTLQINPVDDGNPNVEDFEVVTDYTSVINRNLSPNYTLNNFSLGRNASDGATANLDWPFTFSYVGQTASSGQNATLFGASTATVIQNALTAANSNGGVLTLTPLADQRGYYEFTYRVTDRDGDQDTATATIIVLPTLAQEGNYDGASFYITYNGAGWAPLYFTPAGSNNTLHYTTNASESYEFAFTGGLLSLNMLGSGVPNTTASLRIEFNLDVISNIPNWVTYDQARTILGSGFSCTSTLNGQAPDASSNLSNYSASFANYSLVCRGFPIGGAQAVRVTNNTAGAYFMLNSIDVASGLLRPGLYQETNTNISYSGSGWAPITAATASGSSIRFTTGAGNSYSFQMTGGTRFALYSTPGPTGGTMQVCITPLPSGASESCVNRSNNAATTLWQQAQLFTGLNSATVYTVTVTNVSSPTTRYIDLDAVEIFPPTVALTPGLYQETNANITYSGSGWAPIPAATASGGSIRYTVGAGNSYNFQITGASRFALYTTPGLTGGTM